MRIQCSLLALSLLLLVFAGDPSARQSTHEPSLTREITIISSAGGNSS